ncbi:hypothetical protein G4X40_21415 [Rhodococcus sp. D2-41]|uniref:hypothetical protein n=1 Tax=Speluncibacter jeojiensis TaxID=2710754 RepID=UPI00240F9950|nr:hypothetical protein [Rhodococcus sp. D2-41]MDG3012702.1 hypothetical protein [Rhodococcus sp. D2-41]
MPYIYVAAAGPGTVPMGMSYSGSGGTNNNNSWEKTVGWTAMPAYPDTVIVTDSLAPSAGQFTIDAKTTRTDADGGFQMRVVVSGTVVATSTPGGKSQTVTATVTVNDGDKVWMEHYTGTAPVYARPVLTGAANTYLTITPA